MGRDRSRLIVQYDPATCPRIRRSRGGTSGAAPNRSYPADYRTSGALGRHPGTARTRAPCGGRGLIFSTILAQRTLIDEATRRDAARRANLASTKTIYVTAEVGPLGDDIGSYIIPELIAAGHEITGLARSDESAAAAAESDGVIHVAHRQDLLPFGGIDSVAAAELHIMLAYGDALWPERESRCPN